ncbi:hypothetical protein ACFL47_08905 [Candidatus Latescibacterota bacterium]
MFEIPIKALRKQSLRKILFTSFALIFTLPLLIFFYVAEYFSLLNEQLVHLSIIGFLAFALIGFILLRQIVDEIISIATETDKYNDGSEETSTKNERNELSMITRRLESLATGNVQLINDLSGSNEKLRVMGEKLITYERAAAVNQTVVTLSDQINSPLMIIQGHAEMIKKRMNTDDEALLKSIISIEDSVKKCTDIMNKLRSIREPAVTSYASDGTAMIDIDNSKADEN